jgi:hypothetical protein
LLCGQELFFVHIIEELLCSFLLRVAELGIIRRDELLDTLHTKGEHDSKLLKMKSYTKLGFNSKSPRMIPIYLGRLK